MIKISLKHICDFKKNSINFKVNEILPLDTQVRTKFTLYSPCIEQNSTKHPCCRPHNPFMVGCRRKQCPKFIYVAILNINTYTKLRYILSSLVLVYDFVCSVSVKIFHFQLVSITYAIAYVCTLPPHVGLSKSVINLTMSPKWSYVYNLTVANTKKVSNEKCEQSTCVF